MERTPTTLIVESHGDCREVLALTLQTCGFRVVAARNGSEALAALHDRTPESIVIDNALPDRHALDLVRVLRTDPRFDGTTIVLVGTWLPPAYQAQALEAGVDSVLLKPFLVEDLVRTVTRQRRLSRQQV